MRDLSLVIGAYNESAEAAMQMIDFASGYRPFVAVMPEAANTSVPALSTYEPRVSVPIGALLWGISAKSTQPEGFTVQVTDIGTQKPLFSEPIKFSNLTGGSIAIKNSYGNAVTIANPLHLLPKPMPILTPGILAVKVQNLAAAANVLQLCLHFSMPTNRAALYPNAYNRLIFDELAVAARAIRDAGSGSLTTNGDNPQGTTGSSSSASSTYISIPFDVANVGDNVIVAGNSGGRITIYQLDIWNVAQQTIQLKNGTDLLRGDFANFPAQTGWGLPTADKYHFQLSPGRSFVIGLSAGTQVTGFVKYRIE